MIRTEKGTCDECGKADVVVAVLGRNESRVSVCDGCVVESHTTIVAVTEASSP